jgi:hypothetical protein
MDATTTQARAIIEAFHSNLVDTERQQRELETKENEQQFHEMYSPCNSSSTFHDLQCGHRIQTEYTASCGATCVHPMQNQPFACPTCLIDVVRAEVALDSLTLQSNDDSTMDGTGPTQEDRIQHFANKYVTAMLKKGYRVCVGVPKIEEPRMQFFDQFMRQDGFGGVEDVAAERKTTKPRKRPGTGVHKRIAKPDALHRKSYRRSGTWDYRDPTESRPVWKESARGVPGDHNDEEIKSSEEVGGDAMEVARSEQSADACVDLIPQKEATEAVLKAMEAFATLST